MGGDHKCPVCQATFTRPQHVARHMRSHTGDRPYKCQYCGDQFARSDLLARHVNKCHANEKQPSTTNSRRKGTASASRATTSKQACDQCVQSSLPCDGSNPCSKCVQRKCRCTFVKFHRQTAPAGPGHNPRPSSSSPTHARQQHIGDFILAPPPSFSAQGYPSAGNSTSTFTFPQSYGGSDPQLNLDSDFAARYRAQAELLRRAGAEMSAGGRNGGGMPIPSNQGLYGDSQAWYAWNQHGASSPDLALSSSAPQSYADRYMIDEPLARGPYIQGGGGGGETGSGFPLGSPYYGRYNRRESVDYGGSDTSSTSRSVPSSAASSSLHLPLLHPDPTQPHHQPQSQNRQQLAYHLRMEDQQQFQQMDHSEQSLHAQQQQQAERFPRHCESQPNLALSANAPANAEGGFSSAFGMMSIEDPNVLQGLASDSAPFFSSAAMNMPPQDPDITPMPKPSARQQNQSNQGHQQNAMPLPTPGLAREAETRELREFWKAYIQSPGTAGEHPPQLAALLPPNHQQQRAGQGLGTLSPSGMGGRRARVASLPSAKTPTAELAQYMHHNNNNIHAAGAGVGGGGGGGGSTIHGNADDLRSYEAAVLARKMPTLNAVPRRREREGNRGSRGSESAASASASPPSYTLAMPHTGNYTLSRPSSSASSSSLAYALDRPEGGPGPVHRPPAPPAYGAAQAQHTHSRTSSAGAKDEPSSDRPSFKRLPSQTLGPPNAKRAALDDGGGDVLSSASTISRGVNGVRNGNGGPMSGIMSYAGV